MGVVARNIAGEFNYEFPCPQWSEMTDEAKEAWTIVSNDCGSVTTFGNPYATYDLIVTIDGLITAESPLHVTTVDGVTNITIDEASLTGPGTMSVLDFQKAQSYLEPVSLNTTGADIPIGAVTSITVVTPLLAGEYKTGDIFSVINNSNGERVKLTVTADTTAASTTISAVGTSAYLIPTGAILVPIFSVRASGGGSGTVTSVAATQPTAGFTISGSPITTSGTFVFALADDLAALEGLAGTGIAVRTASNTWTTRTLAAGTGILLSNSDGTAGNPTITNSLPDQTVVLTNGSGISITGTYPNFTIASTITGAALTKTDDTNVTLTLGGAPTTALVNAASITVNWAGVLSVTRGGNGVGTITGLMQGNGTSAVTGITNSSTVGQVLRVTGASTYAWGAVDLADADAITGDLPFANLAQGSARSVLGVTGNATADNASIQGTTDQVLRVNTAGTALAFGQVATGGITDDAVTYAKIQNVVANNVLLGNIGGAGGIVTELTTAQVQTLLGYVDGTGVANRLAWWLDTNTLTNDAAFVVDGTNDRMTITGTLAGTGANNAFLNLNSGAISGATEFLRMSGSIAGNLIAGMYNANVAAGTSNTLFQISSGGAAGGDPILQFTVSGVVTHAVGIDNTDSDKFKITTGASTPGGTANKGLVITNDAAPLVGINLDSPGYTLDVAGIVRSPRFINGPNVWSSGNIAFSSGAGTGPSLGSIFGGYNSYNITFTMGTAPVLDGLVFTATFPVAWPSGPCRVVFSALNKQTATDLNKFHVDNAATDSTKMALRANGTLTASTTYAFTIHIHGYGT